MNDYLKTNKDAWNKKTTVHLSSEFYDVAGFLNGKSSLNSIELNLLDDVKEKKLLHLQCHFGLDTLSLSRLGAKCTGMDFSKKAIEAAKNLSQKSNLDCEFICCDVYDLPNNLTEKFDVIFTSYGVIGWLPDLDKWAKVIAHFLKPDGKLIFVEFHPLLWIFDQDFQKIEYDYFKTQEIVEISYETYTDNPENSEIETKTISWNHGLAEVFTALIENNLKIERFQEFDYSPYNCFKNMEEFEPNKFRIKSIEKKIPLVYAIKASKI